MMSQGLRRRQEELGEGWGGVGRPEKEAGGAGRGLGRGGQAC